MRIGFIALVIGLLGIGWCQPAPKIGKPKAIVVVTEDPNSSELVQITMLNPKFPESEMAGVVQRLGAYLNCAPRGFGYYREPFGASSNEVFVKSKIGVNGLIEHKTNTLKLGAIVKAFAGIPAPYTVDSLQVIFDGEAAGPETLKTFRSDAAAVIGTVSTDGQGIEYLTAILQQDPAKINIPDKFVPEPAADAGKSAPKGIPTNVLIVLIVTASLSAGLLVYFLVLSRGGTPEHK